MEQVDKEIKEALIASVGGIDLDQCLRIANKILNGMEKMAESLMRATYDPEKFEAIARSFAHSGKQLNELYRLMQFARGEPDSRTSFTGSGVDWLDMLTEEQLAQLQLWISEAQSRENAEGATGS